MTAEKRSVSTDALETLGTIITDVKDAGRDAIHLAVEPVIAGEKLYPGQEVGLISDGVNIARAFSSKDIIKALGIVDPFLTGPVFLDQKFWMVLKPRQITSLRHVWSHPDFDEEPVKKKLAEPAQSPEVAAKLAALKWLIDYCAEIGCRMDELLSHAESYVEYDNYWVDGGRWEGMGVAKDFWEHYKIYTGKPGPKNPEYTNFFSCSC